MAWISKKVKYKGITFDSETECCFYRKLEKAVKDNRIKSFDFQYEKEIQESFLDNEGFKIQNIIHKPDFVITFNDDSKMIVDTKGNGSTTEEVAKIKRKMFMYQNRNITYIFIGMLPKYLGNCFVEVSSGRDFDRKLRNRYYKINPSQKLKKGKKTIQWTPKNWEEHFEFENVQGLFYRWKKTKKLKK